MKKSKSMKGIFCILILLCGLGLCNCSSEKKVENGQAEAGKGIISIVDLQEEISVKAEDGSVEGNVAGNQGTGIQKNSEDTKEQAGVGLVVKVNDKYYRDTGKISTALRCGVMDGEITSTVDAGEIPTKENQSNFGKGYSYQYSARGTIDVNIDGEWHSFKEIPLETDVYSIQITNGSTGETLEISREVQPEAFWEVMQKYESLDVKKSENQTPWIGYSYWLQLYDEEGEQLYSVFPKGQYVEINSIRYADFDKTTAVELMLAVDACWEEDLPMAGLVETDRQELDEIEGFSMDVTYATCRGASLQFINLSDKNILFGDSYSLQVYQDGKWYELDYLIDNWAFTSIGYEMAPETSRSWAVRWDIFHGELEPGTYRIVKDVDDFRGTGDYTQYYVGVEFVLH